MDSRRKTIVESEERERERRGGLVVVTLVLVFGGLGMLGLFAMALEGIIRATGGLP